MSASFLARRLGGSGRITALVAAGIFAWLLAGCASSTPVAYQNLSSAPKLRAIDDTAVPFQYRNATANLASYTNLLIDPVTIYGGPDGQFGSVSQDDRQIIAEYMHKKFTEVLVEKYRTVPAPEPGTMRLHLTLTGIETSIPVLSTITHLAPFGLVANTGLQAVGANGTFFGSVSYAAELTDAGTGELIYAYVTKQTPDALDVTASVFYLDAAKTGIRIGARTLRDNLAKNDLLRVALPAEKTTATR